MQTWQLRAFWWKERPEYDIRVQGEWNGCIFKCINWVYTIWEAFVLASTDDWDPAGKNKCNFSSTMETETVKLWGRQNIRRKTKVLTAVFSWQTWDSAVNSSPVFLCWRIATYALRRQEKEWWLHPPRNFSRCEGKGESTRSARKDLGLMAEWK